VKIDLSLVQRAGDDRTHSVLRSIVEVASRMGATTIAEGVETSSQLRTARHLGITAGQGYLLGRPSAERDLTWVDIAALEQRDDVGIPITPELAGSPGPGDGRGPVEGRSPAEGQGGVRRTDPARWPGSTTLEGVDNPLLPPLDATGHLIGGRKAGLAFVRAGTRQSPD
jgi:hypothetical protein